MNVDDNKSPDKKKVKACFKEPPEFLNHDFSYDLFRYFLPYNIENSKKDPDKFVFATVEQTFQKMKIIEQIYYLLFSGGKCYVISPLKKKSKTTVFIINFIFRHINILQ